MGKISSFTRDSSAQMSFYVLLKKRSGIALSMFDDYWRNVHGPVCARLPGQHQYWQFHLAHNDGGFWQQVEGVDYACSEDDQFDGIAELTFTSERERDAWFSSAAILMSDEHNIFSRAIGYISAAGNSTTYRDQNRDGAPNGTGGSPWFQVLIQKSDNVSTVAFRDFISKRYVPAVLDSSLVSKLRVHLLEGHDNSEDLPPAPGVDHFESPDRQYQAAIEIAFNDNMGMESYFASDEYKASLENQADYIKRVNPFPVRDTYTFVYDGRMTLSGQRGSSTASLISNIGALNQLNDDVSHLIDSGMIYRQENKIGA
ncbi:hypothetical protein MNBD_GAMMA14-268 [hydrothermal vent metagenome]|uniref:EthD domain-containing protein n=1 Tax=hydrothermal vent metagenome TaxID=652676 RepID=A0A3B0YXT7_9ZZZZ